MKWLMSPSGDRVHAVVNGESICGVPVVDGKESATAERCGNCDKEWRRRGRETKRKRKPWSENRAPVYRPRNKFKDWDV